MADEISGRGQRQIFGALSDGLQVLDLDQTVQFYRYSRVVLPLDGYVFWIKSTPLEVQGSLHYAQDIQQNEDETYGLGTIQFTTKEEVVEFSTAPTNTIYVAQHGDFKYAFSQQNGFYRASGFFHYFGNSIPPALLSQLVDVPEKAPNPKLAVVSNSLPLWLALNQYSSPFYDQFFNDAFRSKTVVYPAFIVPPNLTPPYVVASIESTTAIQPVPLLDRTRNHYQLAQDTVRITMYGLNSDEALDFMDCVLQYSQETGAFGLQNMPIVVDGRRTQPNIEAIAMQKFIEFKVDYYQSRVADVARQLITEALIEYIVGALQASSGPLPFTFVPPKRISTLVYPPPIYTQDTVVLQTPNGEAVVVVNPDSVTMNLPGGVVVLIDSTGVHVQGNVDSSGTVTTPNLDVTT